MKTVKLSSLFCLFGIVLPFLCVITVYNSIPSLSHFENHYISASTVRYMYIFSATNLIFSLKLGRTPNFHRDPNRCIPSLLYPLFFFVTRNSGSFYMNPNLNTHLTLFPSHNNAAKKKKNFAKLVI